MSKGKYALLLAIFFFSVPALAQNLISGQIIDGTDQQPLIGAVIIMEPGHKVTITDNQGYFEKTIEDQINKLHVKYLGYEEMIIDVGPGKYNVGKISLTRASTTLNEILVSASATNFKTDFKGSNYRINPTTLQKVNPLSTEEMLRFIPGVNIIGDMGLSNRPNVSIRGSWGRRSKKVLLMEDGSPSAPAPYIAPGAYYNPISDRLTSIEVYKGADMLRYGPNNMYGAVNYITALPPQKPELRVKLIGGQRNYQTGLISYGGTWNNLGALVEGVYKRFDGFKDNSSVDLLNLNAKIFAQLSDNQSLYFKVSSQYEDNQATLASQTPFTFDLDPYQNPLDADQFTMRRYGVDIIHKWLPLSRLSFTSKIYASDFERDWWRQVTSKVKASEVRDYVGPEIFRDRYSYLEGRSFGDEDYVIVGRVNNGLESTTDSRWTFTVAGFKEMMNLDWNGFGNSHALEASVNVHAEQFKDQLLRNEVSRWARNGETTIDLRYKLFSVNGYLRNEFNFNRLSVTPILRIEHVDMYRQDLIAAASNPDLTNVKQGREPNVYTQVLPGLTLDYTLGSGNLYGSIYQGMIAPSKVFGFLVEKDGVVRNPLLGESINIDPELSWNREIGWRGQFFVDWIDGQVTYFNNTARNFYAGGRNEVFQQLGKVNVQGIELALGATLYQNEKQHLRMFANINKMYSKILEGELVDNDLFSQVVHNTATKSEFIEKVMKNRQAYEVYVSDGAGGEVVFTDELLTASDFDLITKSMIKFGEDGVDDYEAPYTPRWNISGGLDYDYGDFSIGISAHYMGKQYTEYNNFKNESADGSIGELPSHLSFDANANYNFTLANNVKLSAFVNAKNLTNDIYRSSRLNRATSGVFGSGFRQIIFGINLQI